MLVSPHFFTFANLVKGRLKVSYLLPKCCIILVLFAFLYPGSLVKDQNSESVRHGPRWSLKLISLRFSISESLVQGHFTSRSQVSYHLSFSSLPYYLVQGCLKVTYYFSFSSLLYVIFWPSNRPKNAIPRWCAGRKWHILMASNRKRSRGRIKAYNMGQDEGPTVPLQSDAPEESDLWTAWQLFPLDDD